MYNLIQSKTRSKQTGTF